MDVVNDSKLQAGWLVSKINPPDFALTAVVKGTFQLCPGGTAILAEEQLPVTGDEFVDGDPTKALRYPFDFAPFKPRADVMVLGTCHTTGGAPVESERVTIRLGAMVKSLLVFGDRVVDSRGQPARPEPFVKMPLSWDRAYGGPAFDRNPLGCGASSTKLPDGGTVIRLPNLDVEGGTSKRSQTTAKLEPVGFGPMPGTWPQRVKKVGAVDASYMKDRWPWYPRDFDWGYFNAAPADQQIEGYLRGDESFTAQCLHPLSKYRCKLPGLRVRCFVNETVKAREELREFRMNLDTAWIDMDAETLVLVWRGYVAVRTEKCLEVEHMFVATEPLAEAPAATDACRERFWAALERREDVDEELEPEEEPEEEDEGPEVEDQDDAEPAEEDEPAVEAAPPRAPAADDAAEAEEPDEEAEAPDEPDEDDDELTEARVRELAEQRQSLAGLDLSDLALDDVDFSGLDMQGAILETASLMRANFTGTNLAEAILAGANLRDAKLVGANLTEADLTGATLLKADLSRAIATGADFTGARLRSANLCGATANDAIFATADLSEANASGANFAAADLCETRLHRTDFTGANLAEAALENAWGRGVKAVGANLTNVRAANARFSEADFREANAADSVWETADLYGVNFTKANLNRAEFSGAYLTGATFNSAEVKEAQFGDATVRRGRFIRCNLYETSFGGADLTEANFTEANLFGATLMDATLTKALFTGANLRRIKARQEIK